MKVIKLLHDGDIKSPQSKEVVDLSSLRLEDDITVITFCKIDLPITTSIKKINATSRHYFDIDKNVLLLNIQSSSTLFSHILWDVAHHIDVGQVIYIKENIVINNLLDSEYYKDYFDVSVNPMNSIVAYKKIKPLIIEADKGLDDWSFCIPVGPEEPTFLNKCVSRILDLKIDRFEIILCGQPHKEFRYFDKVRIVGTDIPAPPVHITRKKNVLAQEAKYRNLCILHDRVYLPLNFMDAMRKYGDLYAFVGFQSYYFVDRYNLIPRRYSDFGTIGNGINKSFDFSKITRPNVELFDDMQYICQHPKRANFGYDYLTGSLYVCKRSLWLNTPQNENLFWQEFEDIEQGVRASNKGIPSSINPYSITQSMNSRMVMHYYGYTKINNAKGNYKLSRALTEVIPFIAKKPALRVTEKEARKRMYDYCLKYKVGRDIYCKIPSFKMTGISRYRMIVDIIKDCCIPFDQVDEFVHDFQRNILCDQYPPGILRDLTSVLESSSDSMVKKNHLIQGYFFGMQLMHSYRRTPFAKDNNDWFIRKTPVRKVANYISALYLKYLYRGTFLPMSVKKLSILIDQTTPYKSE
ncbi:Uncharacterised protein [Yersinia intermedia]|uniref:hypothetical protein n=1 Tax=Yersinia intermedia TaxID=631 RepID=UPI0005E56EC8|nr:hypothetical protein [Yersinia intermedia]CQJ53829.1 Uncharacterised protein [Yersinia intermedia]